MPKIDPSKVDEHALYGKLKIDNTLNMGERIRKRFKPTDTVQVINLDDSTLEWQWQEEGSEHFHDEEYIRMIERDDPSLWQLEAGKTDVLQGSCAYLMIEALYKKMAVKKTGVTLHPLDEREVKNFDLGNPEKQEEFIDLCFLGKVTPAIMQQAALAQLESKHSATPKLDLTKEFEEIVDGKQTTKQKAHRTPATA